MQEMTAEQIETALAEQKRKQQELQDQADILRNRKVEAAIAELSNAAKARLAAEEEDRQVLIELARKRAVREAAAAEEQKRLAAADAAKQKALAKEAAQEQARVDAHKALQEALRQETERTHRQEQVLAQELAELSKPKPKPEAAPVTPLFEGNEEKIPEISYAEHVAKQKVDEANRLAANEAIRDKSVPRNLTVDANDYGHLRDGWKSSFNGEMLSDSSAVNLLTHWHLWEIAKAIPQVVVMHKAKPMSMNQAAFVVEQILSGASQ
jgi:hypothetical protein